MANYVYSLSEDFSNGVKLDCLHKQIEEQGFATPFDGVNLEEDNVTVIFTGSLSPSDESELDTIISVHDPDVNCSEDSDIGYAIGAAGFAESLSESSTNSTNPIRKLRLSISDLPSGTYRIGWYYEWSNSSQSSDFRARVQLDDTTDLMYHSQEAQQSGTTQSQPACGFSYQELTEGDHNIDLDYWVEGNNTSYIQRARLEIWRVS
jgi:hypothetical protein